MIKTILVCSGLIFATLHFGKTVVTQTLKQSHSVGKYKLQIDESDIIVSANEGTVRRSHNFSSIEKVAVSKLMDAPNSHDEIGYCIAVLGVKNGESQLIIFSGTDSVHIPGELVVPKSEGLEKTIAIGIESGGPSDELNIIVTGASKGTQLSVWIHTLDCSTLAIYDHGNGAVTQSPFRSIQACKVSVPSLFKP
jgi:hypothetical protein